ncbi:terminase small subunit [Elizabethkingia anophelis]|uniref:terminase small subunit n=1 Tax=Elizabethkingia anophelis TaxID=1117645 RepID=UPI0038911EB8
MAKNGNIHPTRIFKKPEDLENAFNEYKEDLKEQSNEWVRIQYVGKEGDRKSDPQKVPMTLEGFERFCYNNYGCVGQYFDNKDGLYGDFVAICSRIRSEIRENQIIGGLLGFYNPSITQRLNGLTDKTDVTSKGEKIGTQPTVINMTYVPPPNEDEE